ncbi:hypothetical protein CMV_030752, partial [Castanea mollissima]
MFSPDSALRERLNKIMASDYFTTSPELKALVEVAVGREVVVQTPTLQLTMTNQ